ncbi:hypothetical protein [Kitasatospora viridis]|uniref:hypothetical protein n=1 Tax=Kitasatospora viridis TaxID=281105 RepID=UPI00119E1BB9|nr:hypothetical protein [Kitasatospora viridis]
MPRTANATTPRQVRRLTAMAFFGPPLIIGLSLLIANPDWSGLGIIGGTVALIATMVMVMYAAPSGWLMVGGVVLGIASIAGPGLILQGEVLAHQGQQVDVRVTSVKTGHDKNGNPVYTCYLERVDGKPLKHNQMGGDFCDGPGSVGDTETVLVDPYGWSSPQPADTDYSGIDVAAGAIPVVLVLFELLVWRARVKGLRRTTAEGAGC